MVMPTGTETKIVGPNPALMELLKLLVEQNGVIVRTNQMLLMQLGTPAWFVKSKAE